MQAGGQSQRASTGSHASPSSKVLSDSAHSSSCTRPSSVKGKKREVPHHNTSISKRDQSVIISENDPSPPKRECLVKAAEFDSITDKDGGLPNLSAVDQLIHLMQQESKKSVNAPSQRAALVGVIAATRREECLQHFVQLGGLSILDDWLLEGNKGKAGDENSKDTDKIIDEVMLTILHALEKLPIDLEALKACSIGKAVNHLRSHRISEIQKRARKLVDTWKKRVNLEMEMNAQAIGSYQRDTSPVKVADGIETGKVSAESISISLSSDTSVTSGSGSSTSVNPNSSMTQSCIGTRASVTAQKQESSSTACPISSIGSTMICSTAQKENGKNSLANRTSDNHTRCDDVTCRSTVNLDPKEKKKIAEKVVVCGRDTHNSEPSRHPDTVSDFDPKRGNNGHENECHYDGSNGLLVSSVNTGLHVGLTPKGENNSSGNTESQRLFSVEDEASICIEVSAEPNQNSWSPLATDKENESKISKINMIEANGRIENSIQDSHCVKSSSTNGNNERVTEIFVKDDKSEHCPPALGMPFKPTMAAFGSNRGIDSTFPISLVETKQVKGMESIEVKVMKETCTIDCTHAKELDHLGLQGRDEKHSGGLNSCKWEKLAQDHPSNVSLQSENLVWQSSKVIGLEEGVVHPIQSTKDDSSVFNHLEDGHAKQSLPIKAIHAALVAKIAPQSLGEDGYLVAQDKRGAHLDGMDCIDSSCSDSEVKKVDNDQFRIWKDLSSNTAHDLMKVADSFDEIKLATREKSPLEGSQEGNQDEKDKTKSLSSSSEFQTVAHEKLSVFTTENCSEDNEGCPSPVGTIEDVEGSLKISCGATLLERPLEVTAASVVSTSNASSQPVNAMILEKTQPRHAFDLNEGITADELLRDSATPCVRAYTSLSHTLTTPVAVVAATKGGFILPASPLHNKSEIGWKGSAATSAFRPAEPRRIPERLQTILHTKTSIATTVPTAKAFRNVFDFDLNVVDQGPSEDEIGMSSEACAESQRPSISSQSRIHQFPSTNSRLAPHSANKVDLADFDLNCVGEETDREMPTDSISETMVQHLSERPQKTLPRPVMLDFDLNEGSLEEEVHEQVALPVSATTICTNVINPVSGGESNRAGRSSDIFPWHQTCGSIPVVTLPGLNMARLEPAFSGALTQPPFGQRPNSISNLPPSSAMVYPATAPFFGCTPIPYPASFTINPLTIAPDSPFTVTTLGPGIGMSSQAAGQRAVTPLVRPPFVMNIADIGAANGIYSWGRSDLRLTGSTGSTIINCRDLGTQGKEHFVYHGGSASMEENTRFIQQSGLPVASLKRKEPECSWEQGRTGFKQPSWH